MFSLGTFNLIYVRKKLSKIKGYDKELKIVKSIQENLSWMLDRILNACIRFCRALRKASMKIVLY